MKMLANIQTKHIYWYYGGLLIFMFLLMNMLPHSVPMVVRLALTIGFLVPIALDSRCIIFAFSCIWMTNLYSFSPMLPEFKFLYLIVSLIYLFVVIRDLAAIKWGLLIWFYFSMICLVHGDSQLFVMMTIIGIILSSGVKKEEDLKLLNNGIIIASLYLSLLFLLNMDAFAESYNDDLERSSWMNSNTFGSLVCFGSILAVGIVTKQIKIRISNAEYFMYLVTALLGLTVLIINASRGALLSFAGGVALFVFLSRTKTLYKVLFATAVVVLVYLLYLNGYFELLELRMESNVDNVGNRTDIWQTKLDAFSNFDFWDFLFGRSREGANNIRSFSGYLSTHNDFVTALVGYGAVGLVLYLGLFAVTIFRAQSGRKLSVFILLLVLAMEASVVEPIFRGNFMAILFFVFIYKYATIPINNGKRGW